MPRSTTAYLNKTQRSREHVMKCVRGEKFTMTANFAAMLDTADTGDSVTWHAANPSGVKFGTATVTDTTATVLITAGDGGSSRVKAVITTTAGKVFAQLFRVRIQTAPRFNDEVATTTGADSVSA